METDVIERGTYADLVAETPKGEQAYEGITSIDNKDEARPGLNAWLSLWSIGTD